MLSYCHVKYFALKKKSALALSVRLSKHFHRPNSIICSFSISELKSARESLATPTTTTTATAKAH